MTVLKIEHNDFSLFVECANYLKISNRARTKQKLETTYNWSGSDNLEFSICTEDGINKHYFKGETSPVVFFENTPYNFIIDFNDIKIRKARIFSESKEFSESFSFHKNTLFGTINYRNDIGQSDLEIRYEIEGNKKNFILSFEVFPIKLNYREDLSSILNDIEMEYPMLVLDFLRKTYTSINLQSNYNNHPEVIWWMIFKKIHLEFLDACKQILLKPNRRLVKQYSYEKIEQIRRTTPKIEEEIIRFKNVKNHYYYNDSKILSSNTTENQFLKHALHKVLEKYINLKKVIEKKYPNKISREAIEEMNSIELAIKHNYNNPFFRNISEHHGMYQESMVLQKAIGYSTVYKNWIMLKSAYSLFDGMQQIETKNIAQLYEIWCFIVINNILKNQLRIDPSNNFSAQINRNFVFDFKEGTTSRISYTTESKVIDLYYNPKFSFEVGNNNLLNTVSLTVPQQPDIVLQITKNDLQEDYIITYLFDAKYRLKSDENPESLDYPPEDSINQMHRYRDAIFYKDKADDSLKKEVIGGYILFPGTGKAEIIKNEWFYNSIEKVNIGAFPLSPKSTNNDSIQLLEAFINKIVNEDTNNTLKEIIPQKGLDYENPNPIVFVGVIKGTFEEMESEPMDRYVCGIKTPKHFGNHEIKYFAPYYSKKGIQTYYEILNYSIMKRCDAYPKTHMLHKEDETERLVLKLGNRFFLKRDVFYKLDSVNPYRYIDLKSLRNPVNHKIYFEVTQKYNQV